ncbi:MAG: hypothetical protein FJY55_05630, partial [Betaproteobacteria bacterium]|nr:hypothetical protein [Betaproteobacteria bacterium]
MQAQHAAGGAKAAACQAVEQDPLARGNAGAELAAQGFEATQRQCGCHGHACASCRKVTSPLWQNRSAFMLSSMQDMPAVLQASWHACQQPMATDDSMPAPGSRVQRLGLIAGPIAAALCYLLLPAEYRAATGGMAEFPHAGRATLAMMAWMAIWWLTEALPLAATALLPLAAFPLLGIATPAKTAAPHGSDIIWMFFGGFMLAGAIQRWGLDRRIAFHTLRWVGTRPDAVIGGVMAATASISMWVSNTATAAMMVPIAPSVIDLVLRRRTGAGLAEHGGIPRRATDERAFAKGLLLCVACAASIGGMATIVGSPPNGILVRYIAQAYGDEISFLRWMQFALPTVLLFLPIAWWLITR